MNQIRASFELHLIPEDQFSLSTMLVVPYSIEYTTRCVLFAISM